MKTVSFSAALALLTAATSASALTSYTYTVDSPDMDTEVVSVFETASDVSSFYSYSAVDWFATPDFELVSDEILFFLQEDTSTGILSLGVIIDAPDDGSGGDLSFSLAGAPDSTSITVQDDPNDIYPDYVNGAYSFHWIDCCTDGVAISGLEESSWTLDFSDIVAVGLSTFSFLNADGSKTALDTSSGSLSISSIGFTTSDISSVPLPAALPLLIAGFGAMGVSRLRRRKG